MYLKSVEERRQWYIDQFLDEYMDFEDPENSDKQIIWLVSETLDNYTKRKPCWEMKVTKCETHESVLHNIQYFYGRRD